MKPRLTPEKREEVTTVLERLRDQSRNALLLVDFMVQDDNLPELPQVTPDYSVGDFLVFDRRLHPEFKD